MKYKTLSLLFAFATCVIPAHAGVILALDSVTSNGGDGYLQLTLTNTVGSSAINVGGFSFGLSVANGSGVTFGFPSLPSTVVDVVTASNYIFAANSLFGPDISLSGFGTTEAYAADNFDTPSGGTVVNGGETYGLGRIYYNLSGGAPGLLPQISLRRTERELRLIVPAGLKGALGDVTARRLQTAAEAFDLKSMIVSA